jgi:hypothetical protein
MRDYQERQEYNIGKITLKYHITLGREGTAPAIRNLDSGIKWGIVFHYQLMYQDGKSPR